VTNTGRDDARSAKIAKGLQPDRSGSELSACACTTFTSSRAGAGPRIVSLRAHGVVAGRFRQRAGDFLCLRAGGRTGGAKSLSSFSRVECDRRCD
jgi:hypothetical protein